MYIHIVFSPDKPINYQAHSRELDKGQNVFCFAMRKCTFLSRVGTMSLITPIDMLANREPFDLGSHMQAKL